jgi:hypothetical protein
MLGMCACTSDTKEVSTGVFLKYIKLSKNSEPGVCGLKLRVMARVYGIIGCFSEDGCEDSDTELPQKDGWAGEMAQQVRTCVALISSTYVTHNSN